MNITVAGAGRVITILPDMLRQSMDFIRDVYAGEEEGCDHDHAAPLSLHEAGRLALEFVMVGRISHGEDNPQMFRELMDVVVDEIDNPQTAVDVIMSLAGMVNVLADDDDLAQFGTHILKHEARS